MKTKARHLILTLALLFSFDAHSQDQNWFFGFNAGITFNTIPPSALTNGQVSSYEGGSGMSTKNGNLLFYSDGTKVWNKNHAQMPNGFGLLGHESSTQGILIVQDPGDTNKYYIFTIAQLAQSDGLRYTIVDMTLQGGNGDVTQKNVFIRNNLTEKLTGIIRCDGNVWIVTHEWQSKKFYADLLTPSGLNPPVTSVVGTTHTGGSNGIKNSIGHMKISAQGDKLALTVRDLGLFEIFDFNMGTGVLTNPVSVSSSSYSPTFGVEFSPDGSKLYGGDIYGNIRQFDLSLSSASAIVSSAYLMTCQDNTGSMQRGPNGKIYVARNTINDAGLPYLGVINSPNSTGSACNYVDNGVSLGGKKSRWGLPNIMTSFATMEISGDTSICLGDTAKLTVTGSASVQWVQGSSASSAAISVAPTTTTTYSAVVPNSVCGDTVSITVMVSPNAQLTIVASDTVMCPGDSITLTASGSGSSANVQWSGGGISSTQQSIKVSPTANTSYYLTSNAGKCGGADTMDITVLASGISASFTSEASPCGLQVALTGTTVGATGYQWDMGDGGTATGKDVNYTYAAPGNYRVGLLVTNSDCNLTDTVSQVITVLDSVEKPKIITKDSRCNDGTVDFAINNDANRYQYTWTFGNGKESNAALPSIKYAKEGRYTVRLSVVDTLCNTMFTDSTTVYLDKIVTKTFIPNVFTPNGDGINEFFAISGGSCGQGDVMEIYNRWGSRLFHTESPYEEFWDGYFKGEQCAEGVYYYLLFTNNKVERGHLTLFR